MSDPVFPIRFDLQNQIFLSCVWEYYHKCLDVSDSKEKENFVISWGVNNFV